MDGVQEAHHTRAGHTVIEHTHQTVCAAVREHMRVPVTHTLHDTRVVLVEHSRCVDTGLRERRCRDAAVLGAGKHASPARVRAPDAGRMIRARSQQPRFAGAVT